MNRPVAVDSSTAAEAETLSPSLDAAVAVSCEAVSHNLNGQKLGRKGRITRERILRATISLLESPDEQPITLSAVAQEASLGMTSLYNYFNDLTELVVAVLDLVTGMAQDGYISILETYWPDAELSERCHAFIVAYNRFWNRHSRLFHLRNKMADSLDTRIMEHRLRSGLPILRLLEFQLGLNDGREAGSEVMAMSSVLLTGIERTATVATNPHYSNLRIWDTPDQSDRLVEPQARLLELAIRDSRTSERRATR